MVTYYMTSFYVYSCLRAYVYEWSQLFKDESANHKRVEDSVYDSNRKVTLFGEGDGW